MWDLKPSRKSDRDPKKSFRIHNTLTEIQLFKRCACSEDEVYVLEPHPSESNILLSGAHDGRLIIWDMHNKAILAMHYNHIEGTYTVCNVSGVHPWVTNTLLSGSWAARSLLV
jgi:hypothetical protein